MEMANKIIPIQHKSIEFHLTPDYLIAMNYSTEIFLTPYQILWFKFYSIERIEKRVFQSCDLSLPVQHLNKKTLEFDYSNVSFFDIFNYFIFSETRMNGIWNVLEERYNAMPQVKLA